MDPRSSQAFVDSLIENLPDMVFVKDAKDLKFVSFNRAGEEILGISREEMIGKNDYDFFPPEEANLFIEDDRKVLRGTRVVDIPEEVIHTRHHGPRILHTKKMPIFNSSGEPEFLVGISEDITDLKKARESSLKMVREEAANKERELMSHQTVFLSEASKTLSSSLNYRVSMGNLSKMIVPAFADWCSMGIRRDEETIERVASLHRDPNKQSFIDELQKINPYISVFGIVTAEIMKSGRSMYFPEVTENLLRQYSKTDEIFELIKKIGAQSMIVVPIRIREKILGAIAFLMSGSGRKFNEKDVPFFEELGARTGYTIENSLLYETAQDAVKAREEFLSIASHELKTPMTSLNLLLEMSRKLVDPESKSVRDPARFQQIMDLCLVQSGRITNLIDDLLDVSRMKSGKLKMKFENCDLGKLVQNVIDQFSDYTKSSGSEVNVFCSGEIATSCDRFRVEQVILNLLSNAIKYGNHKPIEISVTRVGECGLIQITDHGIGIPETMLGRIFERFERTVSAQKVSGLGLGLYISKQIVLAHRGRIYVNSREGQGSTFFVELPII